MRIVKNEQEIFELLGMPYVSLIRSAEYIKKFNSGPDDHLCPAQARAARVQNLAGHLRESW